jgi:hypothetical protein
MRQSFARRALRGAFPATLLAAVAVGWAATPGEAVAGIVVTRAEGSISVDVDPPEPDVTGPTERAFTADVPGADTVEFTEAFSGGNGRVAYDVRQPGADRLGGDFEARIATAGSAPDGRSEFVLEFTSDLPLRYRLTAEPVDGSPRFFAARLDDVEATAITSALGDLSGTIPQDPPGVVFGRFLSEGTLPAGEHRFTIEAEATSGRSGGEGSAGVASFEVVAVPLPPAAWAALSVMGAMGAGRALRRRLPGRPWRG